MKTHLVLVLALTTATILAQGPLLPPTAPAPSMKSLEQIEPRTAISATTTIGKPGSYYLTTSFTGSIEIQASDVTLDLNGFTLSSFRNGIEISDLAALRNITIRNGTLAGPGTLAFTGPTAGSFSGSTGWGIVAHPGPRGSGSAQNCRIQNVTVRGFYHGIYLTSTDDDDGGRHTIFDCIVRDFGNEGIHASQCLLRDTQIHHGAGFGLRGNGIVAHNLLVDRIIGTGISGNNLNLQHTILRSCSGNGIQTSDSWISGGQISGCFDGINGSDNQIDGIAINRCTGTGIFSPNSTVTHVSANQNARAGVWADSSSISHCTVRLNGADGIRGLNSVISNCKSSDNDTNTADGYLARGIVWSNGRQIDNVCDLYAPAAPAP